MTILLNALCLEVRLRTSVRHVVASTLIKIVYSGPHPAPSQRVGHVLHVHVLYIGARYMPIATCERCAFAAPPCRHVPASRSSRPPPAYTQKQALARSDGRSCAWDCAPSCLFR
ncbi:hypothetical protein EVAR_51092_1 [Eumeta japonica]|uniref:Uncharacterized protein n=1 Tax=Eumeta variegata TaxID=151549 RepID=A0A4C1XM63_EUMVA|nr:hypothetical protein EVAR_51092_1 [Eumeta japonica]